MNEYEIAMNKNMRIEQNEANKQKEKICTKNKKHLFSAHVLPFLGFVSPLPRQEYISDHVFVHDFESSWCTLSVPKHCIRCGETPYICTAPEESFEIVT